MNEVNERWRRSHNELTRLRNYFVLLAMATWPLTYMASYETLWEGHGQWWPVVCSALLVVALGTTVGAAIFTGIKIVDSEPLPGSNC